MRLAIFLTTLPTPIENRSANLYSMHSSWCKLPRHFSHSQ